MIEHRLDMQIPQNSKVTVTVTADGPTVADDDEPSTLDQVIQQLEMMNDQLISLTARVDRMQQQMVNGFLSGPGSP